MNKGKCVVFICMGLALTALFGCTRTSLPPSSQEFPSLLVLAETTVEHLNKGDAKALHTLVVQKHEYVEKYHPYLPETKQGITLPGEDFYYTFIHLARKSAIVKHTKKYKDKIVSLMAVGKPQKVIDAEKFKLLRRVPLTLEVRMGDGKKEIIEDNRILGVVVEENGKYRLLNMFD